MKIIKLTTILIIVSSGLILCNNEKSKTETTISKLNNIKIKKQKSESDVLGGTSNFTNTKNSAITYGLADVGAYSIPVQELTKLTQPTMVDKLPENFDLPRNGPLENVEEIASTTDYYDGSINLNKKKISCRIYGNASDCLKNSSCGWCGSNNSCVLGNNLGPLQSCLRSSFVYSSPIPNWNFQATVQNAGNGDGVKFVLKNK